MPVFTYGGGEYEVDSLGFLIDWREWDENFAMGMAWRIKMGELSSEHWKVIYFIRDARERLGRCPLMAETCRGMGLPLPEFERLFPDGYSRGACRLAGIFF
jgi:tRNA 2-thiouridine synthesizing protein E